MPKISVASLLVSGMFVDTVIGYYLLLTGKGGVYIRQWYSSMTVGAYLMDIFSLVIGTYVATLVTDSLPLQVIISMIIGVIHDVAFGSYVNKYEGPSPVLNLFKKYGDELGKTILVVDALMLAVTIILAHLLFSKFSPNHLAYLGICIAYWALLLIYSFPKEST